MSGIAPIVWPTDRMTLRRLEASDADEFVRMVEVSREHWTPWTPARPVGSSDRDHFDQELDRTTMGVETGNHLRLVALLDGVRLAGMFSLNEIVRGVFQSAYAGWAVSADLTGQGLGTEGVRALIDIAFTPEPDGLGLHRVQANIMPGNAGSIRIAEKIGFRREGVAARYLRIAFSWEDHVMFALTREERDRTNGS